MTSLDLASAYEWRELLPYLDPTKPSTNDVLLQPNFFLIVSPCSFESNHEMCTIRSRVGANSSKRFYPNSSGVEGKLGLAGRESGGVRVQGLSAKGRRQAPRESCERSCGGERTLDYCRRMRLPRRVWLRTEPPGRWQNCQRRERTRGSVAGSWYPRVMLLLLLLSTVTGFSPVPPGKITPSISSALTMTIDDDAPSDEPHEEEFGEDLDTGGIMLEDLNWRVEKLRLEEQNTKRFLKAGPRFLPYDECRKWVQAWGRRWRTKKDWESWIAMGEKRNSYIPSRPEEYYTRTGDWISWAHFLGTEENKKD